MILKDILSISGKRGLYKFLAKGKNATIVEHLETHKRSSVHSTVKMSQLEDIFIFTEAEDISLGKVFDLLHKKQNGGLAIDYKSTPDELKSFFQEVLPNYDKNKVYVSEIQKLLLWYNTLQALDMLVLGADIEEDKDGKETGKTENPEKKETKNKQLTKVEAKPKGKSQTQAKPKAK